jgi:hypothetical protein
VTTALALPLHAADRIRLVYLRALGPLAKPLMRNRELRVALGGSTMLLGALALAVIAPLWLLALGPIVWGVPHVLGDVRYLWVRPGHHRRWPLWIVAVLPLVALSITGDILWGAIGVAAIALTARGAAWRKLLLLGLAVLAMCAALAEEYLAAVVFAHAHNFIGVALWWGWRKRATKLHLIPLAIFGIGTGAILLGALDPIVTGLDGAVAQMDLYFHLRSLAPTWGVMGPRLVIAFAFAQSAHYIVWVRLVPEEDRPRETPRTFRATWEALRADFGWPLLVLTLIAAVGLAIWAAIDLFAARTGYLRAVLFHGHLEVIAAALLFLEGRRAAR